MASKQCTSRKDFQAMYLAQYAEHPPVHAVDLSAQDLQNKLYSLYRLYSMSSPAFMLAEMVHWDAGDAGPVSRTEHVPFWAQYADFVTTVFCQVATVEQLLQCTRDASRDLDSSQAQGIRWNSCSFGNIALLILTLETHGSHEYCLETAQRLRQHLSLHQQQLVDMPTSASPSKCITS